MHANAFVLVVVLGIAQGSAYDHFDGSSFEVEECGTEFFKASRPSHSLLSVARSRSQLTEARAKVLHAAIAVEDSFNASTDELDVTVTNLVQRQVIKGDSQLRERCAAEFLLAKDYIADLHADVRSLVARASTAPNEAKRVQIVEGCMAEQAAAAQTLGKLRKDRDDLWELAFTFSLQLPEGHGSAPLSLGDSTADGLTSSRQGALASRLTRVHAMLQETKRAVTGLVTCLSRSTDQAVCSSQEDIVRKQHSTVYGQLSVLLADYERAVSTRNCSTLDSANPLAAAPVVFSEVPETQYLAWDMQPRMDLLTQAEESIRRRVEALSAQCSTMKLEGLPATVSGLVAVRGAVAALRECQEVLWPKWSSPRRSVLQQVSSRHRVVLSTAEDLRQVLDSLRSFDWTLKQALTFDEDVLYEGDRLLAEEALQGMDPGKVELLNPSNHSPVVLVFERSSVQVPNDRADGGLELRAREEVAQAVDTTGDNSTGSGFAEEVHIRRMILVHDDLVLEALQEALNDDAVMTTTVQVGEQQIPRGSRLRQESSAFGIRASNIRSLKLPAGFVFQQATRRKAPLNGSSTMKLAIKTGDATVVSLVKDFVNISDGRLLKGMRIGPVSIHIGDQLLHEEGDLKLLNKGFEGLSSLRPTPATPVHLVFLREATFLNPALNLQPEDAVAVRSRWQAPLQKMGMAETQVREVTIQQGIGVYDRSTLVELQKALQSLSAAGDWIVPTTLQKDMLSIPKGSRILEIESLQTMLEKLQTFPGTDRFFTSARVSFEYTMLEFTALHMAEEQASVKVASAAEASLLGWAFEPLDSTLREGVRVGEVALQAGDHLLDGNPSTASEEEAKGVTQLLELFRTDLPAAETVLPSTFIFSRQRVQIVHSQDSRDEVFLRRQIIEGATILSHSVKEGSAELVEILEGVGSNSSSLRTQTMQLSVKVTDGGLLMAIQTAMTAEGVLRMPVGISKVEIPRGSKLELTGSMEGHVLEDVCKLDTPATLSFTHHVWVEGQAGAAKDAPHVSSLSASTQQAQPIKPHQDIFYDLNSGGSAVPALEACPPCNDTLSAHEEKLLQSCVKNGASVRLCGCAQVLCSKNVTVPEESPLSVLSTEAVISAPITNTSEELYITVDADTAKLVLASTNPQSLMVSQAMTLPARIGQAVEVSVAAGDRLLGVAAVEDVPHGPSVEAIDLLSLEEKLLGNESQQVKFVFEHASKTLHCYGTHPCARMHKPVIVTSAMEINGVEPEGLGARAELQHCVLEVADRAVLPLVVDALGADWRMHASLKFISDYESDAKEVHADVLAGSELLRTHPLTAGSTMDDVRRLEVPVNLSFSRTVLTAVKDRQPPAFMSLAEMPKATNSASLPSNVVELPTAVNSTPPVMFYKLGAPEGKPTELPSECRQCQSKFSIEEEALLQSCLGGGGEAKLCDCHDIYCTIEVHPVQNKVVAARSQGAFSEHGMSTSHSRDLPRGKEAQPTARQSKDAPKLRQSSAAHKAREPTMPPAASARTEHQHKGPSRPDQRYHHKASARDQKRHSHLAGRKDQELKVTLEEAQKEHRHQAHEHHPKRRHRHHNWQDLAKSFH
mmetsp:Transcript_44727/g.103435  ORF Transcript_44727/g.103435 Transcript_44727/m.103435 type:complete len:1580 (+) Transcript_44727:213-4952(+)